ncbi:3-oxoacyl-[acyl-carrier-protein] synthase 3 [Mycobacterium talmoniae]|uniref:3-oxoacyl-[acyl-carrier-protein] synthase 3 n=1 Tax=Mycobacterium talmoniae TaxID=1858794 RepID=A0A2S8BIS1_9MYCO|nr:3-oxoacyl-[acyl-carrier-protein] synthase 3 [Mycobacterium talmoniae]
MFDQPGVRRKAQAAVPGDGAAVGLVTVSERSPILDVVCRTYGEYAGDMTLTMDPPRKWWQAGPGEACIGFTESKITKVLARGNRQVPEVAWAVCDRIGVRPKDIGLLVTNQPNRVFLRNWREALELPTERHVDTFDQCGNLFGAAIPINFDRAVGDGRRQPPNPASSSRQHGGHRDRDDAAQVVRRRSAGPGEGAELGGGGDGARRQQHREHRDAARLEAVLLEGDLARDFGLGQRAQPPFTE